MSVDKTYTGPQLVTSRKHLKILGPYVISIHIFLTALQFGNSFLEKDFHTHISSAHSGHYIKWLPKF